MYRNSNMPNLESKYALRSNSNQENGSGNQTNISETRSKVSTRARKGAESDKAQVTEVASEILKKSSSTRRNKTDQSAHTDFDDSASSLKTNSARICESDDATKDDSALVQSKTARNRKAPQSIAATEDGNFVASSVSRSIASRKTNQMADVDANFIAFDPVNATTVTPNKSQNASNLTANQNANDSIVTMSVAANKTIPARGRKAKHETIDSANEYINTEAATANQKLSTRGRKAKDERVDKANETIDTMTSTANQKLPRRGRKTKYETVDIANESIDIVATTVNQNRSTKGRKTSQVAIDSGNAHTETTVAANHKKSTRGQKAIESIDESTTDQYKSTSKGPLTIQSIEETKVRDSESASISANDRRELMISETSELSAHRGNNNFSERNITKTEKIPINSHQKPLLDSNLLVESMSTDVSLSEAIDDSEVNVSDESSDDEDQFFDAKPFLDSELDSQGVIEIIDDSNTNEHEMVLKQPDSYEAVDLLEIDPQMKVDVPSISSQPNQSSSESTYMKFTTKAIEIFGVECFLRTVAGSGSDEETKKLKEFAFSENVDISQLRSQSRSEISNFESKDEIVLSPAHTSTIQPLSTNHQSTNHHQTTVSNSRLSFEGGNWKSRQSFLPTPSEEFYSSSIDNGNVNYNTSITSGHSLNDNLFSRSDKYLSSSSLQTSVVPNNFHALAYDRKRDSTSQYFELPFSKRRATEDFRIDPEPMSILGSGYSLTQLKAVKNTRSTDPSPTPFRSAFKENVAKSSDILINPTRQSMSSTKTMSFLQRRKYDEKCRSNDRTSVVQFVKTSPKVMDSDSKASSIIAKRILNSLSTLASPKDEQSLRRSHPATSTLLQRFGVSTETIEEAAETKHKFAKTQATPTVPKKEMIQPEKLEVLKTIPEYSSINEEFAFRAAKPLNILMSTINDDLDTQAIKFAFSPAGRKNKIMVSKTTDLNENETINFNKPTLIWTQALPAIPTNSKFLVPTNIKLPTIQMNESMRTSADVTGLPKADSLWTKALNDDKLKCPSCLVPNEKSATKCVSCETTLSKPCGVSLWESATKSDKVKCPSCMVPNDKLATKCVSCEATLSSDTERAMFKSNPFSVSTPLQPSESQFQGFTFKPAQSLDVKPPVSSSNNLDAMPSKKRAANGEVSSSTTFNHPFSAPKPFTFGTSAVDQSSQVPSGSSFTLGAVKSPVVSTPSFAVNETALQSQNLSSTTFTSTAPSFTFGGPISVLGKNEANLNMFSSSVPPHDSKVIPDTKGPFGSHISGLATADVNSNNIPSFSFGKRTLEKSDAQINTVQPAVSSATGFSFGGALSNPSSFSSGHEQNKTQFGLGTIKDQNSLSSSLKQNETSSINSINTAIPAVTEKPTFGTGFSNPGSLQSISTSSSSTGSFLFGAARTENTNSTTAGASTNDNKIAPPTPFMFGSTAGGDKKSSPFIFGAPAVPSTTNEDKKNPTPFIFGTITAENGEKTSTFTFVTNDDKHKVIDTGKKTEALSFGTTSETFSFGSNNKSQQSNNSLTVSTPLFGSAMTDKLPFGVTTSNGSESPNSAMDMGYNSGDGSNLTAAVSMSAAPLQSFPSFANSLVPSSTSNFGFNSSTSSSGIAFGNSAASTSGSTAAPFMFSGGFGAGIQQNLAPDLGASSSFSFGAAPFGNIPPTNPSASFSGGSSGLSNQQQQNAGGLFSLGSSDNKQSNITNGRRKVKVKRPQ